ncbi:MAG TPA: hypothetical protein VHE12_03255 [bacterium]|nr:hypothetical protein [bacterium]
MRFLILPLSLFLVFPAWVRPDTAGKPTPALRSKKKVLATPNLKRTANPALRTVKKNKAADDRLSEGSKRALEEEKSLGKDDLDLQGREQREGDRTKSLKKILKTKHEKTKDSISNVH